MISDKHESLQQHDILSFLFSDNTCDSYPCQHGGQCDVLSVGHSCACKNGYSGGFCECKYFFPIYI